MTNNSNIQLQRVATAAFIVRKDGSFLVGERSQEEDFLPGYIELIGGGSKWGEEPEQAVVREVKEESGLDVDAHVPLMTITYMMKDVHRVMIVFFCTLKDETQEPQPSHEHSRLFWVTKKVLAEHKTDDFMDKVVQKSTADLDYWLAKYFPSDE